MKIPFFKRATSGSVIRSRNADQSRLPLLSACDFEGRFHVAWRDGKQDYEFAVTLAGLLNPELVVGARTEKVILPLRALRFWNDFDQEYQATEYGALGTTPKRIELSISEDGAITRFEIQIESHDVTD